MSSYVYIELDTTSPTLQIYAPSYTTANVVNTIVLESDESLSDFQDIYMIDSDGTRHDYVFQKEDSKTLLGRVDFSSIPIGLATVYAQVVDEVGNISNLFSKEIEVKETLTLLKLKTSERTLNVSTDTKTVNINIKERGF